MLELKRNFICRPYRGVSIQEVECALDSQSLRNHLMGRPVYRRTDFLVMVRRDDVAVVQVDKASTVPLFSPVTDFEYLAGPREAVLIEDDTIDTANPSQMARVALSSGIEARIYVIKGKFQHVNFIVDPVPLQIRVVEVVPPEPTKLLEMARKVVDYDERLPPIELLFVPIDLRSLADSAQHGAVLFPCRSSGLELDGPVYFLDAGPQEMMDWTLIGCERSRQIHGFFYKKDPSRWIDMCPRVVEPSIDVPTLTKCCLIEEGVETSGACMVVPWGGTLEEVRHALHELVTRARESRVPT